MSARKSKHVRRFLQAATARRQDAQFLLTAARSLGAVYLGGYAVECALKALILSLRPEHEQRREIDSFRGGKAHEFQWLLLRHRELGGANFPPSILP